MTGPPDGKRAGRTETQSDDFVERLGDRLSRPHQLPPDQTALPSGEEEAVAETSDVHALGKAPIGDDDVLEVPPPPSAEAADAFAEFEDDFTGETTRIDDSNLLAEESTSILEAAPAQPFLAVERGKDMGREFVLQDGQNGVGRGIDNDVILADVSVSRRHLRIMREGDELILRDLGSGNGTVLNGKRVSTAKLCEGDRIELGETTLVVRMPGAPLPAEDPYAAQGEATDEQNIADGMLPSPGPNPTPSDPMSIPHGPGYQPELTPSATRAPPPAIAPTSPKGAIVLPKPIFIAVLAGGALLLAMFGAAIAVLLIKTSSPPESPTVAVGGASSHYELGVRAYNAQRWEEAQNQFTQALADPDPPEGQDHEQAQRYLRRTALALQDQSAIDRAQRLHDDGQLEAAAREAGSVRDAESPLHPTAQRLLGRIQRDRAGAAVAAGRAALEAGELEEAQRQLDLARGFDPDNAAVTSLRDDLARETGEAPADDEPEDADEAEDDPPEATDDEPSSSDDPAATSRRGRSLPRRVTSSSRRRGRSQASGITPTVIAAYLQGDFARAAQIASVAAGQASGREAAQLEALAENIRRFGRLWPRIRSANFGASVRRQMSEAMALDARIANNPHYRSQLRSHLVALHLASAQRQRSNPVNHCREIQAAYRIDSTDGRVRQASSQCETIARGMLNGARSAPATRRRTIYGQILSMVPNDSQVARTARDARDAMRRAQSYDEDE